jgi:hypothetical protein
METNPRTQRWQRSSAPLEDWRNLIRDSASEDELVSLVRDHLARWTPDEIGRLPEDCRPGRIRDGTTSPMGLPARLEPLRQDSRGR